jgi:predicted nucleic acid-binding protein
MLSALLDACVLYPARVRDLLLSLAAADLFQPKWSELIQAEWITSVLANRPDLTGAQLEKTRDAMNQAFPDASVRGFERIVQGLVLPDPDDRHILATAIHAGADLIVTTNLKDFPPAAVIPYGIDAVHPDEFVDYLFDRDEDEAFAAVAKMRGRLKAPPMNSNDFVESIAKAGLPLVAARLRTGMTRI